MSEPKNPEELLMLFSQALKQGEEARKPENLKYVIYARKSTDEKSDKQLRSIPDQISECKKIAKDRGLKIVETFPESESAKEPDIRPEFRKMLDGIKCGKYDGIITWHPDRLARNMKDAGEVIDLIDKGIIKHLECVSFTFTNDTAGKMLLGMTFVLSKQYSDALSDNVKRGIRKSIEEGRFLGKGKHGYIKDRNQFLRPDPKSFSILRKIWGLRLENKTGEEIANFLNNSGYTKRNKEADSPTPFKMNKQRISEILKDSFYCGILTYGENIVNLLEIYDFVPMTDAEVFCQINNIKSIENLEINLKRAAKRSVKANLLRGKIICGCCEQSRTASITTKKLITGIKKRIFYYKCETKGCKYFGKSTRARVIVEFVKNFLEQNDFAVKEIYDYFEKQSKKEIEKRHKFNESRRKSLSQYKNVLEREIENSKNLLREESDSTLKAEFKSDLKSKLSELEKIKSEIEDLKNKKNQEKNAIMNFQKFLELWRLLPSRIAKIKKMETLDKVIQLIFSNFTVEGKEVALFTLKTPFKEVYEKRKNSKSPQWSG